MANNEGKTLLVTGGSRGIGAAVARMAGSRGYHVALNYHQRQDAADAVCAEIRAAGGQAMAIQADLANPEAVLAMFAWFDDEFGRLDVLVNNAGVVDQGVRFDEVSIDRIERMYSTNVTSSLLCAREAVRRMSSRHGGPGGSIVNVSSMAAVLGSPGEYVDYASSKGAIDSFTVGLAREVATEGIRVNAVRPGVIDTDIHSSGGEPNRVARIAPTVPMQRAGTADEVACAILWLASEEASYVTGHCLNVSGGR